MIQLDQVEARVIGSLAEKQLTTPQQYPLTFNALLLACNQTSNRDPVVNYDEGTVEKALASLKDAGLLRFVHPSHGRSATRYRQVVDERFGLDVRCLSLLAVLLLRGPQTVGELRARTERMTEFDDLGQLQAELDRLSEGADPLVRRLHRRSGQKEERWTQLLTGEISERPTTAAETPFAAPVTKPDSPSVHDEITSLRAEIGVARDEVAALKAALDELKAALGW